MTDRFDGITVWDVPTLCWRCRYCGAGDCGDPAQMERQAREHSCPKKETGRD